MKKQSKTTKQYSVTGSNTFKTKPDLSDIVVDRLGNLYSPIRDTRGKYHDATRDVTEKDAAIRKHRELIEAKSERDYAERNGRKDYTPFVALTIALTALATAMYFIFERM